MDAAGGYVADADHRGGHTRHAAHVCGLEDELGTLEAGKIADVLAVEGDPLQDLQALANVRWVVHEGAVIRAPDG